MSNKRQTASDNLHYLWYVLLPEPPRFLQLVQLSKFARTTTPWLATVTLQSAILIVPGLLWYIAGVYTYYQNLFAAPETPSHH